VGAASSDQEDEPNSKNQITILLQEGHEKAINTGRRLGGARDDAAETILALVCQSLNLALLLL